MATRAACTCGWSGPTHPCGPDSHTATRADLAGHLDRTGHHPADDLDAAEAGVHRRCGHRHDFQHDCPVPYHSPAGQLLRLAQSSLARRAVAADRIAAATTLARWVDDQTSQGVISARLAGLSWGCIAQAADLTVPEARQRWGRLIDRLEAAGLLLPADPPKGDQPDPASLAP